MTDGEALFRGIGDIIGRRQRISELTPESGTFELHDEDRTVRVTLAPDLLTEYFSQLNDQHIPGLSDSPAEEQDLVRAETIVMWIEEIFESDIRLSLAEIRLERSAAGISLVDRRGSARRSFPLANTESGSWSPDRPGT